MAVAQRYFDDLEIGDVFHSFARTLTEAEIIDFAWAYDPQPFHISAEGGAQSMFGAIIASGLQTLACLLYTSPSPRDLSTSRMPSSA